MLTLPEKIIFAVLFLASLASGISAVLRLTRIIGSGRGRPTWRLSWKQLVNIVTRIFTFQTVFRSCFWTSLFHALVGWGFGYYIFVNLIDVIRAYNSNLIIPGTAGGISRLLTDLLSMAVLVGMLFLIGRRFLFKPLTQPTRELMSLYPKEYKKIQRDSAIVAGFIFLHVGARSLGESFAVAMQRHGDKWQPFVSMVAHLWSTWSPRALIIGQHISFWLALGVIVFFSPYISYSKHIHIFFAPINLFFKSIQRSMWGMTYVDMDDHSIDPVGAARLADLGWKQLIDSFACTMCFRCQDACPAYKTGKSLSPAIIEINKRYQMNTIGIKGQPLSETPLLEFALSRDAVWACTFCGACMDVCPVGNEPMRDILEIRRELVLMKADFPDQLKKVFYKMAWPGGNPWGIDQSNRMNWANNIIVPTIAQNQQPDILWWVGCAPASNDRAQKIAQAFAKILNMSEVNYAVLGEYENCTGDIARRAGNEEVFFRLAQANVKILNKLNPERIVTTCPHCLHTLKNEYPAFGGHYEVIHYTELLEELIRDGKLQFLQSSSSKSEKTTYHDPCYLGRQGGVVKAPRNVLRHAGVELVEMLHHGADSFCCGAGGAQIWKGEELGRERVSAARLAEAKAIGATTLVVSCPFCMAMLNDAASVDERNIRVQDVAEIIASRMQ